MKWKKKIRIWIHSREVFYERTQSEAFYVWNKPIWERLYSLRGEQVIRRLNCKALSKFENALTRTIYKRLKYSRNTVGKAGKEKVIRGLTWTKDGESVDSRSTYV